MGFVVEVAVSLGWKPLSKGVRRHFRICSKPRKKLSSEPVMSREKRSGPQDLPTADGTNPRYGAPTTERLQHAD
jgi:hypothetical protein